MRKPKIIKYKGHEIVYLDFSNMRKKDSIIETERLAGEFIQQHDFNSLLVLSNMEDMLFDHEIRDIFLDVVKENAPYIKAAAAIGVYSIMSIMYDDFIRQSGRNIKQFKTKPEALDYLISFV
jgi:hypothetical protein